MDDDDYYYYFQFRCNFFLSLFLYVKVTMLVHNIIWNPFAVQCVFVMLACCVIVPLLVFTCADVIVIL